MGTNQFLFIWWTERYEKKFNLVLVMLPTVTKNNWHLKKHDVFICLRGKDMKQWLTNKVRLKVYFSYFSCLHTWFAQDQTLGHILLGVKPFSLKLSDVPFSLWNCVITILCMRMFLFHHHHRLKVRILYLFLKSFSPLQPKNQCGKK